MVSKKLMHSGAALLVACLLGVERCRPRSAREEAKATGTMSEAVYHGVDEATKLIAKKQMREAIEKLTKLADERLATSTRRWSTTTWGSPTPSKNDYANAAKAFAKAVALKALPQQQHEQLQFNLGQLYIVAGQHDEGIKVLQDYIAGACKPPCRPRRTSSWPMRWSRASDSSEALPQIDLALSKAKSPNQSWYEMKLAVSYELKDFKACAQTLVQLIGLAPVKPDYWKQLSSMFFEMKSDLEAVAVLAVADRQGFIDKPNERQESLQRVHDARPAVQGGHHDAGVDRQGKIAGGRSQLSSPWRTRGSTRAKRRGLKPR